MQISAPAREEVNILNCCLFSSANILFIGIFLNSLQPSDLPVGPVPLHSHHLSSVSRHTAVPPYCAIVCHHGDNWQCHGGD